MFSDATPKAFRKPTQNWLVVQIFRTLGMPTRSCERSLGGDATEGFFANQVGNIRKGIFRPLDFGLDDFHFVQIFHESFGTRIINNHALPASAQGNFAPLAALASVQFDIDEA